MSTDAPYKAGLLLPHMETAYCLQPRHQDDCVKARCSLQGKCPAVCYAAPIAIRRLAALQAAAARGMGTWPPIPSSTKV